MGKNLFIAEKPSVAKEFARVLKVNGTNIKDLYLKQLITPPIIKEKEVDKLVLGLPKNMNGTIGERGEYILKFKELLESELGYDVVLEDERLTTKVAENILINADMSRKKRKKVIDKMAATVILQGYLDRL